jgi:hypothetical protein
MSSLMTLLMHDVASGESTLSLLLEPHGTMMRAEAVASTLSILEAVLRMAVEFVCS